MYSQANVAVPSGSTSVNSQTGDAKMANRSDAVIIAAALIQSDQFTLADFDVMGQPIRHATGADRSAADLITQADEISRRDWRTVPALVSLRKLTDAICSALSEPTQLPKKP
jgi:hypothetical protein